MSTFQVKPAKRRKLSPSAQFEPSSSTLTVSAAAVVLALGLQGCGGGGGSGEAAPATIPVTGYVSKAPVDGASCTLYNAGGQALGRATSARGEFQFTSVSGVTVDARDGYTVQCAGGQYLDEATGQTVSLGTLSAPALVDGNGRLAVLTPLTQLAWDQAGHDSARVEAAAAKVATAFGLQGIDLLKTRPTDVNVQAAGSDAAGRYGMVLAAVAQYAKDTDQSLSGAVATLAGALAGSDRLAAAQAVDMKAALDNLTKATQNANSGVRSHVASADAAQIGDAILSKTLDAGLKLPTQLAVSLSQGTVQLGSAAKVVVTARSTSPAAKVFASSNPAVATVSADGAVTVVGAGSTVISVQQAAGNQFEAGADEITLNVSTQTAPEAHFNGVGASKSVVLGDASNFVDSATFSCASEAGYAPQVSYQVDDETVATVDELTGAVRTRGTGLTTVTASVPAVGTCAAQSVSHTLQVTAPAAPVLTGHVITSATTVAGSLVSGGNAGTWTLRGTGLAGYVLSRATRGKSQRVLVNGTLCKSSGLVNAAGTEISGVDCTNVLTADADTAIEVQLAEAASLRDGTVSGALFSGTIPMVPAPIPNLSATMTARAVKIGATSNPSPTVTAHSLSSGAFAWSVDDTTRFSSEGALDNQFAPGNSRTFSMKEGAAAGVTTVTLRQQAVPGQWAEAVKTVALTVSDRDIPVGLFEGATDGLRNLTLGDDAIKPAAAFTCASKSDYAPTVKYSVEGDAATLTEDGMLNFSKAGSVTVTAKVEQDGTCAAGESSMVVTAAKATPTLAFSEPPSVVAVGRSLNAKATVSGLKSPAYTGSVMYSSSNEAAVTVDADGNIKGVGAGKATITATATGDDNYNAPESKTFVVDVRDAVVSVTGLADGETVQVKLTSRGMGGDGMTESVATASFGAGAGLPFKADGLKAGDSYVAAVTSEPITKICAVSSATAEGAVADVNTSIEVNCSDRFVKVSTAGADLPASATSWCATKDLKTNRMWEAGDPVALPGGGVEGTYDTAGVPTNALAHREKANATLLCGFNTWVIPVDAVPSYLVQDATKTTEAYFEANDTLAALFGATSASRDATHWLRKDSDWVSAKTATAAKTESAPADVSGVARLVRPIDAAKPMTLTVGWPTTTSTSTGGCVMPGATCGDGTTTTGGTTTGGTTTGGTFDPVLAMQCNTSYEYYMTHMAQCMANSGMAP